MMINLHWYTGTIYTGAGISRHSYCKTCCGFITIHSTGALIASTYYCRLL